jgi:hypothetical protein
MFTGRPAIATWSISRSTNTRSVFSKRPNVPQSSAI